MTSGSRNTSATATTARYLLGPLAATVNGTDGEAVRLACAATGSSSAGAVGPHARSDARARDAGRRGGGGGSGSGGSDGGGSSGDGYDDDGDDFG